MGYRNLIIFLLSISFSSLFLSTLKADENPLVRELIVQKGDSSFRSLYYYNIHDEMTLETTYVMRNDEWGRKQQTEWLYNAAGHCVEQSFRIWDGMNWVEYYQINFDHYNYPNLVVTQYEISNYNSNPLIKKLIEKEGDKTTLETSYNWVNGNWLKFQEVSYTYDSGRLHEVFINTYTNNLLQSTQKIEYLYEHELLQCITVLEKRDAVWYKLSQVINYYEQESGLKFLEISSNWNDRFSFWENFQKVEYKYNAQKMLEAERFFFWQSKAFWANSLEYQYDYNSAGVLIEKRHYTPIHRDFRLVSTVEYKDFSYGKASVIEARNEFWSDFDTNSPLTTLIPYQFNNDLTIADANRILISYIEVDTTLVTQNRVNNSIINVYPNPSDGIFYFDTSSLSNALRWVVLDLNGKEIVSKVLKDQSGVIDLVDYQSGIYILQVITEDGVKSQKLIKK